MNDTRCTTHDDNVTVHAPDCIRMRWDESKYNHTLIVCIIINDTHNNQSQSHINLGRVFQKVALISVSGNTLGTERKKKRDRKKRKTIFLEAENDRIIRTRYRWPKRTLILVVREEPNGFFMVCLEYIDLHPVKNWKDCSHTGVLSVSEWTKKPMKEFIDLGTSAWKIPSNVSACVGMNQNVIIHS